MSNANNYVTALTIKIVTIAAGQTVSDAIDTGGATLLALYSPDSDDWVNGDLTFFASPDGITYTNKPIVDSVGDVYTQATVTKGEARSVDASVLAGFEFLKIKSSVTQTSEMQIKVALGPVIAQQNIG